jgi:hypothetical protein
MAELDQAPATTTADTPGQKPAGELRPGSGDSQTRYPNGVTAADTDPSYYDGDMQAALAANTTPTRQQAARDAAASDQQAAGSEGRDGATATSHDPPPSSHDADIDAILHENDNKPDPRTRQQAARDAAASTTTPVKESAPDVPSDAAGSGRYAGIEAMLHENDNLPDPRTRQQAARDAAAENSLVTRSDGPAAIGDRQPESGTGPLAHVDKHEQQRERGNEEWPSAEDRARLHETYLDWRNEIAEPRQGTGWEQGVSVVGDKPDKSPGDRSGLPPTGEELIHLESDDASRLERLGNKIYEEFDDIADVAEKVSNRAQELFDLRPPAGHPEVRVPTQPYVTPTAEQHETADAGNIAQLGLVLGVIGFRTYQSVRRKLGERKGGSHGGH